MASPKQDNCEDNTLTFAYAKLSLEVMPEKPVTSWHLGMLGMSDISGPRSWWSNSI